MKKIVLLQVLIIAGLILAPAGKIFSQSAKEIRKKEQAVRLKTAIVDSQHYVFYAQSAMPSQGIMQNLSYGYEVQISSAKIDSYLPYFGIAYSSDYGSSKSPLEFISSDFTYSITGLKKGGWEIIIETKDTKYLRRLVFTVYENGRASLQVTGNDRQPISFTGRVEPHKEKKG